jgi:Fur family peroxide stress response transcriptional regulator
MNVDDLDYFQDLDDKIAQMTGFRMENHNIVFQGVCPECQIEELEAKKREVEMAKTEGRKPDKVTGKL